MMMEVVIGEYGIITFNFTSPALAVSFDLHEPYLFSQLEWERFGAEMKYGHKNSMTFCDSNGIVSMSTSGGDLTFTVMKTGAGGGGSNTVCIKDAYAEFSRELKKINIEELKAATDFD
jgi:hypothetical protein